MTVVHPRQEIADVYLDVVLRRGRVRGESASTDHADEILVRAWNWGATANLAQGTTQATGRRSYRTLVVTKSIDSASTALLMALSQNEEVRSAKLSMRKAGEGQLDFLTIELTHARVGSIDYESDAQGDTVEKVSFSFTGVKVEYRVQRSSGQQGAAFTFEDDLGQL